MNEIIQRECRFVFHVPSNSNNKDTHIVKEILHYEDGSVKKNLRLIENFKRPFWTTKEHHRNHKQKKESEALDNVLMDSGTESDLARAVGVKLGNRYVGCRDLRAIRKSSFVYGLDINSRTYIKRLYQEKYPDKITPYEVCGFDIEVNTITNDITILTISTEKKMYTVITKSFLQQLVTDKDSVSDIEKEIIPKLNYLYDKHIPKIDMAVNMVREYKVVEDELAGVLAIIAKMHEWEPDLITVWNIEYEMGKILPLLSKHGIKPEDVFCSPKVPKALKRFKFKKGSDKKVTESGKVTPINPEERWHTIDCPASFYWVDGMCTHRFVRVGGKSIPGGYGLDNVLKYELGDSMGKLKFDDDNIHNIKGIDWHKYMTANRPLEYIIYNQWDVMSMLVLDDKTKDLKQVMPMLAGVSNFDVFNSGPKQIIDALHFFYLDNNRVLSVKDPVVENKDLLGLSKWIVLLPSCRISDNSLNVLKESGAASNIRMFTYDSDQVSGYPSDGQAANISIDTTVRELKSIEGMQLADFKHNNINLLFGKVNALSYGNQMFNLPTMFELLDAVDKK